MENWGLITYREYYLFIDDRRDPFLRKRSATSIIGHELIHQWFGNLITCPWWDEIYINEAYGSIGGYLGKKIKLYQIKTFLLNNFQMIMMMI